jgi:hypothetical protein
MMRRSSLFSRPKGFRGEVAILTAIGQDAIATSYWESREAADAHNSGYKKIVGILAEMIEDRPAILK